MTSAFIHELFYFPIVMSRDFQHQLFIVNYFSLMVRIEVHPRKVIITLYMIVIITIIIRVFKNAFCI